jgi:hypothetical protein
LRRAAGDREPWIYQQDKAATIKAFEARVVAGGKRCHRRILTIARREPPRFNVRGETLGRFGERFASLCITPDVFGTADVFSNLSLRFFRIEPMSDSAPSSNPVSGSERNHRS